MISQRHFQHAFLSKFRFGHNWAQSDDCIVTHNVYYVKLRIMLALICCSLTRLCIFRIQGTEADGSFKISRLGQGHISANNRMTPLLLEE